MPDAPTQVSAVGGNTQVTVYWTPGTNKSGSALTGFKVYNNGQPTLINDPNATSAVISGLTNGTLYSFQVTALNAVGESGKSNTDTATPATVPGAPTNVTATPGNGTATMRWTAPSSNGAVPSPGT